MATILEKLERTYINGAEQNSVEEKPVKTKQIQKELSEEEMLFRVERVLMHPCLEGLIQGVMVKFPSEERTKKGWLTKVKISFTKDFSSYFSIDTLEFALKNFPGKRDEQIVDKHFAGILFLNQDVEVIRSSFVAQVFGRLLIWDEYLESIKSGTKITNQTLASFIERYERETRVLRNKLPVVEQLFYKLLNTIQINAAGRQGGKLLS